MSAPVKKRRRIASNNKETTDMCHRDVIHFCEENSAFVDVKWAEAGCSERLKYAAMFDSPRVDDAVTLKVWGAPFELTISKRFLSIEHAPLVRSLVNNSLTISRYAVFSICNQNEHIARDFWMTVWNYVALLYGLTIDTIDSCRWINVCTPGKLSLRQCIYLLALTDFLCDSTTRTLVITSLNNAKWPKNWMHCFSENTVNDTLTIFYRQGLLLEPQNSDTIIKNLLSIPPEKNKIQPFTADVINFLQSMITRTDFIPECVSKLMCYECVLYENSLLTESNDENTCLIDDIFISLNAELWTVMKQMQFKPGGRFKRYLIVANQYPKNLEQNQILCNSYELVVSRLQCYWSFIFQDAPETLTNDLAFSGSVLPMCCLRFEIPVFKVAVATLFSDDSVDVYITRHEQPELLLKELIAFLTTAHEHVWKHSENTVKLPGSDTVLISVSYILYGHPLFQCNHCLAVRFIYCKYSSTTATRASINQLALNQCLCPERVYFRPKDGIMIAPSALRSWITGYMKYYRGFESEPDEESVFKYIQRRFGVISLEHTATVFDCNSVQRLRSVTHQMLSTLPEDIVTSLKTGERVCVPISRDQLHSAYCVSKVSDDSNESVQLEPVQCPSVLDDGGVY